MGQWRCVRDTRHSILLIFFALLRCRKNGQIMIPVPDSFSFRTHGTALSTALSGQSLLIAPEAQAGPEPKADLAREGIPKLREDRKSVV